MQQMEVLFIKKKTKLPIPKYYITLQQLLLFLIKRIENDKVTYYV